MMLTVLFGVLVCVVAHAHAQCGKGSFTSHTIVGGSEATANDWPWMVSLSRVYNSGGHGHFCGGTLVSNQHVVTAAHCVRNGGKYQIRLGDHDLKKHEGNEQTIKVTKVFRHRNYGRVNGFDIAVLKLEQPANVNSVVSLACLDKDDSFPAGTDCVVTGWGTTSYGGTSSSKLMQVVVPLRTHAECENSYPGEIGSTELCAGLAQGGKDSCQGDSGGPLVCKNTQTGLWHLTGVVSWGYECAYPGKYGVYAKVSALHSWIADKLAQ